METAFHLVIPKKLQSCAWLFLSLLSLIVLLPVLRYVPYGRSLLNVLQWLILFTAVMAIGHSRRSFVIAGILIVLAALLHVISLLTGNPSFLLLSQVCSAIIYTIALVTLLNYVLLESIMDSDRLYGAASIYLMLGILWTFLYGFLLQNNPEAFNNLVLDPNEPINNAVHIVYFSFTTLTTTGYGDITPASPTAQMLANIEQITGILFVAILIARLVGFYSPHNR